MNQLILTLLLIPGLIFATQHPAQDFGQVPDSISNTDSDYKENEYKEDEKVLPIESNSSVPASRSYAIGEMPSNTQNNETNSPDAKSGSDRPTYSPEYYEQRVDALLAETKKFLKQWANKGLYIEVSTALEHISIVKNSIALFEAIDHGDIEYVRTHIANSFFDARSVLLNFNHHIAKIDDANAMAAKRIIITLSRLVLANEGITPLMRAAARGDTKMVAMLLANDEYILGGRIQSQPITISSWMVDPMVEIDMKDICRRLQKDICGELYQGTRMKLIELLNDLDLRQPFAELFMQFDELTLAAIGGHEEIVDLLLIHEAASPRLMRIMNVLKALSTFSNVAHLSAAQPLFKNLGIPDRQHVEKYPSIARKLVKALGSKFNSARDEYLKENEIIHEYADSYNKTEIRYICQAIMHQGSPAVALAIADELSLKPGKAEWGSETCGGMVRSSKSGEKLGLILSMDSHPESLTFQFGMGMLSHVEKNPTLLANLKKYIEANVYINKVVNNHLLPDLSPIVADYIYPRMPAEHVRYIMALGNRADDYQTLLGEDIQGIMIGERSVVDTTRANRARRSMCSWLVQKMFETCRRRYL